MRWQCSCWRCTQTGWCCRSHCWRCVCGWRETLQGPTLGSCSMMILENKLSSCRDLSSERCFVPTWSLIGDCRRCDTDNEETVGDNDNSLWRTRKGGDNLLIIVTIQIIQISLRLVKIGVKGVICPTSDKYVFQIMIVTFIDLVYWIQGLQCSGPFSFVHNRSHDRRSRRLMCHKTLRCDKIFQFHQCLRPAWGKSFIN